MTTHLLGIRVPEKLHQAAHTSATLNGKTLKDWLTPIIEQNLHPDAIALFFTSNAQQIEQRHSIHKPVVLTPSPSEINTESLPKSSVYWWHVDGDLVEKEGDTTSGTRVASGSTAQEAIEKVITACTTLRSGSWRWVAPPIVVRHDSHRDDNCPICKRIAAVSAPAHSYNPEQNHED